MTFHFVLAFNINSDWLLLTHPGVCSWMGLPSSPSFRSAKQLYEYDLVCRLLLLGFNSPLSWPFILTSISLRDASETLLDDFVFSVAFFMESKISASLLPSSFGDSSLSRFNDTGLLALGFSSVENGLTFSPFCSFSTSFFKSSRLELTLLFNPGLSMSHLSVSLLFTASATSSLPSM